MSWRNDSLKWALLLPIAALYFVGLPRTVQDLDSGELVLSAHSLLLPHPPGYPLYVWLQHLFLALFPVGTVFWKAAFLNSLFTLGGVAILLKMARGWLAVALVAAVAVTPVVWRYALVPDVFALHFLLTAAILYFYLDAPTGRRRTLTVMLLFGLASANHQTVIFLSPLLLHVLWQSRSLFALGAAALGATVTIALYLSILLFDYDAYLNLYEAKTPGDVLHHFLRLEYGGLSAKAGSLPTPYLFNLLQGLEALALVATGALGAILLGLFTKTTTHETRIKAGLVLVCAALYYFLFFAALNFPPLPAKDAVRERFFVFLAPLLAAAALKLASGVPWSPPARILTLILAFFTAASAYRNFDRLTLAKDTLIEDYARNLLEGVSKTATKPAILILDLDTKLYAVRYAQHVLGLAPKVIPVGVEMTHPSYTQFLRRKWPALKEGDAAQTGRWRIDEDFLRPNLKEFDLYHTLHREIPSFKTTYLSLGKRLDEGSGFAVDRTGLAVTPREPDDMETPSDRTYLFSEYRDIDAAEAMLESKAREGSSP